MAGNSSSSSFVSLQLLVLSLMVQAASGDTASDLAECGNQLVGMQTCIAYVQGEAKTPTPDCCSGLKDVLAKSPKCLCILVKDHDDPQLPIKINVTRALALPSACATSANISACPKILNLPPNSKEAQIFNQTASPAQATGANSTVDSSTGTYPRPTPQSNSGSSIKQWGWSGLVPNQGAVSCAIFFVMHFIFST